MLPVAVMFVYVDVRCCALCCFLAGVETKYQTMKGFFIACFPAGLM